MELWRQCAAWLIECRVLPDNHRVTWENAQVCDLAQALRDGVLLCQLLNNLLPQAVNLREINLRPQMSQFLCLKNIRTFLGVCLAKFYLKKSDLFEAFDLFDVRDFGKVQKFNTISCRSFPIEGSNLDEEIYSGLSDYIDETLDEDDDLYDFVEDEEDKGDEIYEDLMKIEEPPERVSGCCLQEIRQTEEKYSETLESVMQHFRKPLERFLQPQDIESIFSNIEDLAKIHRSLLGEVRASILNYGARNLYQVFLDYKERLLLYGSYCSQVEMATKHLDKLSSQREDIRMKLEECSNRANSGRFSLRDLLMVPMQRVLKYHLLLQELVKHTTDAKDKENLRLALDAMRDLAQCVNEVKRDNEIIRQITTFQLSIENMTHSLALYGRPKIDGELKICTPEKKSKHDRFAFLFDKAMFVCKKKSGETFELKEIIELQSYQIRDEPSGEKDNKKWSHVFLLLDVYGGTGYDLYFKTRELKKKWLEQFEMALSNLCPENSTANRHDFQMHCFEGTASCKACSMLLRGIFFQGYRCTRCKMAAHKECLGRVDVCGRNSGQCSRIGRSSGYVNPGFPKMEVCQDYYGLPPPPVGFGQPLHLSKGDIVELTRADADLSWWEVMFKPTASDLMVHCSAPCGEITHDIKNNDSNLNDSTNYLCCCCLGRFAGNLDRAAAKNLLTPRSDGTFLVRQKDGGEFAISIKFNMDIRHIKITTNDGLFRINDKKAFRGLLELIRFYQQNSLKEYFKEVDTALCTPFKQSEKSNSTNSTKNRGRRKGLSVARARYDYSARDRSELSLQEGDTIKIISKKGHSGWWKGEVYGRVGLFPANYVDEDFSEYC
uniref:Osteoclast-stimulating factor 1 n=1 Tax=Takifugu rubripes TaxID=31033 RepID=H2UD66_TAKRU